MPGLTAYAGLTRIAQVQEGDASSSPAPPAPSARAAGQIARLLGRQPRRRQRRLGREGAPGCSTTLGFDAAFDYKDGPVAEQLREAAPDGIDVYFDNVGGDHLEAAIGALRRHGRIAALRGDLGLQRHRRRPRARATCCLIIGQAPHPARASSSLDHEDLRRRVLRTVGAWLADGKIAWRETVVDGIDNAVDAFLDLLRGGNTGKMLVRL